MLHLLCAYRRPWSLAALLSLALVGDGVRVCRAQPPQGTSPGLRLVETEWDLLRSKDERTGGSAEWGKQARGPEAVTLAIPKGMPAQAYLVSRQALEGDFEVQVDAYLEIWGGPPGSLVRTALIVSRPEDNFQRRAYAVVREARPRDALLTQDGYSAWLLDAGKLTFLPRQPTSRSDQYVTLRLVRRRGVLTAACLVTAPANPGLPNPARPPGQFRVPERRWVELARFDKPCDDPLRLMLAVSNKAETDATTFPDLRVRFSNLRIIGDGRANH